MKDNITKLLILILLLTPAFVGVRAADAPSTGSTAFVDIDGDGIDDNARDANEDGIPDRFAPGYIAPNAAMAGMTLKLPGGMDQSGAIDVMAMNHLQHFAQLSFFARGLDQCRSNLESQFSGGIGVGITGGGGPCAGGVCF